MMIPKLHYIAQGNSPKELLENIQNACTSGIELVQLRMENASEKKVLKVAKEVMKITSHYQTRLIINRYYKVAKEIKADGVYLEKTDTSPTIVRKYLYTWQSIGAAANTLEDCEKLLDQEIDYISLGPFSNQITNKNLNTALGLNGYTAITDVLKTPIPILGFGKINIEDVKDILKTGISGIVVSNAITKNFNTIKTFNQLLNASVTQEQRHTFK
ncbi:thiamine phosphate synthase [Lacinutrix sp. C3R15]|uniref:thiamine phosphate synthase n=1 Tax=Flavobacteriaceae TaxID=49546 RepID=UPI001C085045|nr:MULTISPECIES: thiamine phosphate synthase [Flavobacteriaceae]MBU2938511.1 thiamine phosphate synthase [Lacinutrix sp. C3R15]MDO6621825.1 thiamine phosphate synthase [Oceanihabitans sp. 1_MG-2023]